MFRVKCKFTTPKGSLKGGSVVDQKELDKHFSKKEQESFIGDGLIVPIVIGDAPKADHAWRTLEELLDTEDKNDLRVPEIDTILEHYGLDKTGNKAEKVNRIDLFEEALDSDISELDDAMLLKVAAYCKVDTALEREEMVEAVEEALGGITDEASS
ncbi:MAG TPA: hypothetical protein CFH81_02180 [Sulfurovum sp. UBA12169]|nr:MAG TPA: hypothetical protein CFH81_02180 [Sulfurovum sp. UBA12169]